MRLRGAGYFEEEPAPDSYSELDGRKIRSVQPPEGMGDIEAANSFDTNALPSEWRQWLSGVRAEVPSAEESAELAQQAAQLQQVPQPPTPHPPQLRPSLTLAAGGTARGGARSSGGQGSFQPRRWAGRPNR